MPETNRKPTLSLLLFPLFQSLSELSDFCAFLKTALVVEGTSVRVCDLVRTAPPGQVIAWLSEQIRLWDGPLALFYWAGDDSVEQTSSKIGTLDWKLRELRQARKVLMVKDLEEPHFLTQYPSLSADGSNVPKPLLLVRAGPVPSIRTARELANFLGTHQQPRAPTQNLLAVTGAPSKPPRGDQTVTGIPLTDPRTGKVQALAPPSDEGDERPTLPPPPGTGPPEPVFAPRPRGDATPTR